jgi:exodeoxyribonuclease-3
MSFNILFGGGDEQRFARVLEVVRRHAPDLLVMQECMEWRDGDERVRAVADAVGVPFSPEHVAFGAARPRDSGRRYHVVTWSHPRILGTRTHADPAVQAHALLEVDVEVGSETLRCFGTHLDAHDEDTRLGEARYLRQLLGPVRIAAEPLLLIGDLNSLSPRDPYPEDLGERLRSAGVTKYGDPPRRDVVAELEDQGWVDTLYAGEPPQGWITAPRDRGGVHIDYRTDYVLASPPMAARLEGTGIHPLSEGESDHFPIWARFAT